MSENTREIRIEQFEALGTQDSAWLPHHSVWMSGPNGLFDDSVERDEWFDVSNPLETRLGQLILPDRPGDRVQGFKFYGPDLFAEVLPYNVPVDVKHRITELEAAAADEGINPNEASKAGLLKFIVIASVTTQPKLTLRDSGNFRAVWECANEGQIGIEFESTSRASYVILNESNKGKIERHYGSCLLSRLDNIVEVTGVSNILKSHGGKSRSVRRHRQARKIHPS